MASFIAQGAPGFLTLILGASFGVMFAIPLALILQAIPYSRHTPVNYRDYKPDKGTVKVKFRFPDRAAPLLRALGIRSSDLHPLEKKVSRTD